MKRFVIKLIFVFSILPCLAGEKTVLAVCYGPGLYGNKTATGQRLTQSLLGVAHLHWPLGTNLKVKYKEKETILPVVDRGPYAKGVELDLTEASVRTLGFKNCREFGSRRLIVEKIDKLHPLLLSAPETVEKETSAENLENDSNEKETAEKQVDLDNAQIKETKE